MDSPVCRVLGLSVWIAQFVECLDTQCEGPWFESSQWRLQLYCDNKTADIFTHLHWQSK